MSSTRHAPPGSPLRQNRFASSTEIERGLRGNLVALRMDALEDRADRELVFWLQGISGTVGLKQFTAEFLAAYRARLGSNAMRQFNEKPGKHYTAEQVRIVRTQLRYGNWPVHEFLLKGEVTQTMGDEDLVEPLDPDVWGYDDAVDIIATERTLAAKRPTSYPVAEFVAVCDYAATRELESELQRLCLDPAAEFAGPWYFHELITCLREYKTTWAESQTSAFRDGFAHTALSYAVWREIDDVYEMGGTVLLHNSAGNGKSYAAQSFCAAHPGRARYVQVPATNDETGFLRAIAESLGVASGLSIKAIQMRERILPVLRTGDIVLVLDSAQWLFPVSDYRYALPNRINWVLSELSEQGVPVVMIADTKLFDTLGLVEARTGWNRAKLVNQLSRMVELPAALAVEGVQAVAAALLPDGDRAAQRKLADLMIGSQSYLHAGKPAAQRARRIAVAQQRDRVTLADMTEAIEAWMVPALKDMNAAMKRADAAAAGSKSKVRNYRGDTEAQVAAKAAKSGKRRNEIITSSDLKKTAPHESAVPVPAGLGRSEAPLKEAFSAPEATEFPRSRTVRVTVPAVSADSQVAELEPA